MRMVYTVQRKTKVWLLYQNVGQNKKLRTGTIFSLFSVFLDDLPQKILEDIKGE
jgi:hypothetical protein